jgi:Rrf2 family iron-sulfur cluster assembly transcriptional regulator
MLSQQSKYAIRAIQYLRACPEGQFCRVDVIAEATGLPAAFLAKVLKQLVAAEILTSRRGKNGGVALINACFVSMMDVCRAVEDPVVRKECVLHKHSCRENKPCAFHGAWSVTKDNLLGFLESERI